MKHLVWISALLALLSSFMTCATAWSQSTAQVSGTVKDSTGAALPGVEVTMTQTATGFTRSTVTNETGSYAMPSLPVGPYKLEAALPGFSTFVQTGILLQVDANPVVNVTMQVGQLAQKVEVEADAALVDTRTTGVGQVIDNVRVVELPLNGRQVSDLIVLSGASVAGGAQASNRNYPTASISVAGGLNSSVTYLLDGGTHNDPFNNLSMPMPFPDALQEFKVETSALTAQYGQHAAGAVNAVTKSGTNEFHGDLFEFVRNGALNARNAFAVTRDSLKRNQLGATIGGPVVKNKLFFFAGEQATLQRSAPTDSISFVPTPAMLAGDWTGITAPACNGGRQITLKAPFVNNRINPALFSTPALNLLKQQGFPSTANPCGLVHFGRLNNSDEHIVVSKVDYTLSSKHSLFGRYQFARLDTPSDYDGSNLLSVSQADYKRRVQSLVLGDTYLIGTGVVSSFRGTFFRTLAEKNIRDFFTFNDLGVKGFYYYPGYAKISLISVAGAFSIYSAPGTPGYTNSTGFQFAEDLSWVHGAHQLTFGANFIDAGMNLLPTTVTPGSASFTAINTGMSLGDFMLGKLSNFQQQGITPYYFRQNYTAMYAQDTWKANAKLTVNAGIRWEPFWSPWEKYGHVLHYDKTWFDQGIRSTVFPNAPAGILYPGDAGIPNDKSFYSSRFLDFSPRFGLAWDPKGDGRMTIRAAYGLFFDYPQLFLYDQIKVSPPWASVVSITNPVGGFADPWQGYPGGSPFPYTVSSKSAFANSQLYVAIPEHLKAPYIHQWNLSVQRQIGTDWLVAANYLGNSVIHVISSAEGNPAVYLPGSSCVIAGTTYRPCSSTSNTIQRRLLSLENPDQGKYYGNLIVTDDGGTRQFDGLILSVQRRRNKGVTVQANYTWSHCIDTGTVSSFSGPGRHTIDRRGLDRGNCELDRRHNFNASTVYETPQFSSSVLRTLATGWQISGIVRILSGPYLTVGSGLDNALTAVVTTTGERPNQVLASPYAPHRNIQHWLNPAAFAQPALGSYGNLGAQNILGPGFIGIDMGLVRKFQIREKQSVEFRAEAFNMPNHVNPCAQTGTTGTVVCPVLTLSSGTFGQIQSASDPRIIQLALKYVF